MSAAQLRGMLNNRAQVVGLTVEQYHRMIQTGILLEGSPIELLCGVLVRKDRSKSDADPKSVSYEHAWLMHQLWDLGPKLKARGYSVQVQLPITILPDSEPEPDASIFRGTRDDYRERHPEPGDVACVIEVADSSLGHDRTTKQRIYADAAIAQYLIVNPVDKQIEDYCKPQAGTGRYRVTRTISKQDEVQIILGTDQVVKLAGAELLP